MVALDENLLQDMRDGKVVLFLGAGASRGAESADGRRIPDAAELGRKISEKFLAGRYSDRDFKSIYDFSCSRTSVREVQVFVHNELERYNPAPFHELIPGFVWAGVATTNYDLIIERAYQKSGNAALQHLRPFRSDEDIPEDGFDASELLYNKLHGCITEYQKVAPPLIASTDQIIDHRDGRAGQFQQFLEWAQTRPIVFAGYRADDSNLRTLINQIVKEGDKRPRHYIVRPDIEKEERDYWEDKRFRALSLTFEGFLVELNSQIPLASRKLATMGVRTTSTSFSRFISVSHASESEALIRYFSAGCEHVTDALPTSAPHASRFYGGFDIGWASVQADLDVSRRIARTILADQVVARGDSTEAALIILKAHAGAGKSVILRRIAWDAARLHDKLVLYVTRSGQIDLDRFDEIFSLTNRAVFLVADNAAHFTNPLENLMIRARKKKWPLVILTAERVSEWNVSCEALEDEVDHEYELKYLSKSEIEELLQKLQKYDCLGFLASIPERERAKQLEERYGRQLLVALHEATRNANFQDIVTDEYKNITPAEARLLYLDICALNRFGTPVRAGLIKRVHGIDFDEFKDRFFRPLEEVVALSFNTRIRDYTYEARHPLIAEMVYSSSLVTMDERFDNLMRIIAKLNPAYSYDEDVLFHLVRASTLGDLFPDRVKGAAVYEKALDTFGETPGILHQMALYEMHRAGDAAGLDRAQGILEKAIEKMPTNRAMQHSLAEIALRRSRLARNETERQVFRQEATKRAQALTHSGKSSFPFHTMAKAANDEVEEALKLFEAEPDNLRELAVNEAIMKAEEVLRKGLQRFPADDRLLTAEAELWQILKNAPRALLALTKAFKSNPRSELVARRLATVQKASDDLSGAIATLREALSYNGGSPYLNFDMATALRELAPDADQRDDDAILFHYGRGFRPGDKNYQARFWYARQLWIRGKYPEARRLFDDLRSARMPFHLKAQVRAPILDSAGRPVRFNGQIERITEGYGFIRIDGSGTFVYFSQHLGADRIVVKRDMRVTFGVSFSLMGPQAIEIAALLV